MPKISSLTSAINRREKNYGKITKNIFLYTFLIFYSILSIFPFCFTLISSFKTDQDIFFRPFSLPEQLTLDNYIRAWGTANMGTYFINSLVLSFSVCLILIITCSMAAYALAKFEFALKKKLFLFFLAGLMIPIQSTILPLAFNIGRLGIHNSVISVILIISAFQIPINILIFTGFISAIPEELEEAAVIDGCSVSYVFSRIILPLSVPAIVTVTIMNFLAAWNNLLIPLVFISKDSLKPIAIGLLSFFGEKQSDYSGIMAAVVLSCIPPFVVYALATDKIEKGLTAGAVKG